MGNWQAVRKQAVKAACAPSRYMPSATAPAALRPSCCVCTLTQKPSGKISRGIRTAALCMPAACAPAACHATCPGVSVGLLVLVPQRPLLRGHGEGRAGAELGRRGPHAAGRRRALRRAQRPLSHPSIELHMMRHCSSSARSSAGNRHCCCHEDRLLSVPKRAARSRWGQDSVRRRIKQRLPTNQKARLQRRAAQRGTGRHAG